MLNPFPSLLTYSFDAPTLLRIFAALIFFYIAWQFVQTRRKIETVPLPIIGKVKEWMVWLAAAINAIVGVGLFVGYETQWSAILGMLIALKHGFWVKRFHSILPFSRATYVLLFIICLSLLLTGAGAIAFDVRL